MRFEVLMLVTEDFCLFGCDALWHKYKLTDISDEHTAYNFRVKNKSSKKAANSC
jgi:hypothetical protein